jgi:hypothetical protein
MKQPWFKFYPADWRSDEELRNCGPAARGLWIEMLCLMHKATPYGHLLINGEVLTDMQLAVQTGVPSDQLPTLIGELEKAGVFSRTGKGVIYSRKMVRDEKKAKTAKNNGKNGGNPTLSNQRGNKLLDNPEVKPPDKGQVKPQTPDTICQTPEIKTPNTCDTAAREGEGGVLNNGIGGGVFKIEHHLTDDELMEARQSARGWDIYALMRTYNEGVSRRGIPKKPGKAFLAWIPLYTKGKQP